MSQLFLSVSPLGLPAWRTCCHVGSDRELTGKSQAGGRHVVSRGKMVDYLEWEMGSEYSFLKGEKFRMQMLVVTILKQIWFFYLQYRPWLQWQSSIFPCGLSFTAPVALSHRAYPVPRHCFWLSPRWKLGSSRLLLALTLRNSHTLFNFFTFNILKKWPPFLWLQTSANNNNNNNSHIYSVLICGQACAV